MRPVSSCTVPVGQLSAPRPTRARSGSVAIDLHRRDHRRLPTAIPPAGAEAGVADWGDPLKPSARITGLAKFKAGSSVEPRHDARQRCQQAIPAGVAKGDIPSCGAQVITAAITG